MTARAIRMAAGFTARALGAPLADVLKMKTREFLEWRDVALELTARTLPN